MNKGYEKLVTKMFGRPLKVSNHTRVTDLELKADSQHGVTTNPPKKTTKQSKGGES